MALQFVILLVEEVHLILQLQDSLLILLILVLEVELLHVLSRHVKIVETKDLIISNFDLGGQLLGELLLILELLLQLSQHLVVLLASLIGLSDLLSPLALVDEHGLLHLETSGHSSVSSGQVLSLLQGVGHLYGLLVTLEVVVLELIELAETLDDLVLARVVYFLECFLHLSLEPNILSINLSNSLIFGVHEELEILALLLE